MNTKPIIKWIKSCLIIPLITAKNIQNGIHRNSIEGFWAILKRGIMGQFHWVSKKHQDLYLDEFCYRYNARNAGSYVTFDMTLSNPNYV